jgi:hypothetical protein
MADIVNELASKCGISPDAAKKGLGTLLVALKHSLPAESFAKIESAIPNAGEMLADVQGHGEASAGGFLSALKDMAGKLFGVGGPEALTEYLGKLGLSADQTRQLIPHAVECLRSRLPDDVMKHVSALLPHEEGAATHEAGQPS